MNWLVKLAALIPVESIPDQIYKSIINTTEEGTWELTSTTEYKATIHTPIIDTDKKRMFLIHINGINIQLSPNQSLSLGVYVNCIFSKNLTVYDSNAGHPELKFQVGINRYVRSKGLPPDILPQINTTEFTTPYEIAKYVNEIIQKTKSGEDDEDNNNDGFGDNDPSWDPTEPNWEEDPEEDLIRGTRARLR